MLSQTSCVTGGCENQGRVGADVACQRRVEVGQAGESCRGRKAHGPDEAIEVD